jgi:hypothetical protein
MRRSALLFLLSLVLLAGAAQAGSGNLAAPACDNAAASLWSGNPLTGAVFLAPPNGCTSICSASNGQSCSPGPVGKLKSCYDVSNPDGCGACTCTAALVWSCDPGSTI